MTSKAESAQSFVPIQEIRDGIIVLKDKGLRAILMASSLNFALKSAEEQQAILFQFQNFLNSLEFSTQIFVQSRRLDIRPYLATLETRIQQQTSELMKIQMREYIGFIKTFVENSNIMTKTFFLVIPYNPPPIVVNKGIFARTKPKDPKVREAEIDAVEEHRSQLEQRIAVVEQGLVRTGVRVAQLGTEEVIELFYKLFNPGEIDKPIQF